MKNVVNVTGMIAVAVICLCFSSCQEEGIESIKGGGNPALDTTTTGPVVPVITYADLKAGTFAFMQQAEAQREVFFDQDGDLKEIYASGKREAFLDLENFSAPGLPPAAFAYYQYRLKVPTNAEIENWQALGKSRVLTTGEKTARRQQAKQQINSLGFSLEGQEVLLAVSDYMYALKGKELEEVRAFLTGNLKEVAVSNMQEIEQLMVSQVIYYTLANVETAHALQAAGRQSAGDPVAGTTGGQNQRSCLTGKSKEEWIDVAESMFDAGIAGGVAYGWQGVRLGAAATLASGNPFVGAVVGGMIGFAIGFAGGAALAGGAKLVFDCIRQAMTESVPLHAISCGNGTVFYANTASPPAGCKFVSGDLRALSSMSMIPVYGRNYVDPAVIAAVEKALRVPPTTPTPARPAPIRPSGGRDER